MSTYLNPNAFTDLTKTKLVQGDHEIWYKSINDEMINPSTTSFGSAKIVSNKQMPSNGIWVIEFDSPVYYIPEGAFANSGVTDIWIPGNCTDIESNAFVGTHSLHNIDISGKFINIYDDAFGRSAITHLTLKSKHVTIYDNAFAESSLESITFTSVYPPDVGYESFNHTENLKIYVPTIAYDTYLQAFNGAGITNVTMTAYATKEDLQNVPHAETATELTGRLEATAEVFTYRPSAGDKSIRDDNAFIRRVKGNSVVWNQMCDFTNGVFTFGVSSGIKDAEGYTITTNESNTTATIFQFNSPIPFYSHKWLTIATIKSPIKVNIKGIPTQGFVPNTKCDIYSFYQSDNRNWYWGLTIESVGAISEIKVYNYLLFDLTQMFGVGNEPDTIEEFRALYPDSYYPYNTGELRNLVCSGIKTVGFNQWDEQWEVGGLGTDEYGSPITFDGMIRSTNYNPIFPSTEYYIRTSNAATYIWYYDSDKKYIGRDIKPNSRFFITPTNAAYFKLRIGDATNTITTYNHDICINLHHTGYRDGEYAPYKEVTHALPLSKITNGEPLRKAGGEVYDEINETEYIRRVGVRGYATGDKDDATLITDGRYTNYPLDEPIVKPIETPIDFNYYVEDFGTEEAILAENSAPFSADIVYQFNAVDRIRQNDLNINRLEDKVLALPSEFKTINGNSIIGSGDLIITAGNVGTEDDDGGLDDVNTQTYLRYVEQSLTDEQKLQARINIGASSNIIIGNATQDTTLLQHNTLLKWAEDGTTESMFLEFPTNDGSTVLNCGFLLYLTPDATSDYSLYLDGIEIYWANNTTPELEPEYYYEMWFTSYDGGGAWFGVFTKYIM